jgi:hypothetical protein
MNVHATFKPEKYEQFRRHARVCGLLAKDAATDFDRWTLLTMRQSWLALAENEEWLAGQRASRRAVAAG